MTANADHQNAVLRVVDAVKANLDSPLAPTELADLAGFSRFHFDRVFLRLFGESLADFTKRLRLERAAHALQNTDQTILEIALDAGFSSHEAFTRAFQAWYKVTPSAFRTDPRLRYEITAPSSVHYATNDRPAEPILLAPQHATDLRVENTPPMRFLCLQHRGPYHQLGETFGALDDHAARQGITFERAAAFFYSNPDTTHPDDLRSDAGLLVGSDVHPDYPDLHILELPAGEFAVSTHLGHYRGLSDAWVRFCAALPSLGRTLRHQWIFELYVNDCFTVPEPEVRTDLYYSLQPKG